MNDQSILQFGKHKGKRLIDVPADYLLFLLNKKIAFGPLLTYIQSNKEILLKESEKLKDEYLDMQLRYRQKYGNK